MSRRHRPHRALYVRRLLGKPSHGPTELGGLSIGTRRTVATGSACSPNATQTLPIANLSESYPSGSPSFPFLKRPKIGRQNHRLPLVHKCLLAIGLLFRTTFFPAPLTMAASFPSSTSLSFSTTTLTGVTMTIVTWSATTATHWANNIPAVSSGRADIIAGAIISTLALVIIAAVTGAVLCHRRRGLERSQAECIQAELGTFGQISPDPFRALDYPLRSYNSSDHCGSVSSQNLLWTEIPLVDRPLLLVHRPSMAETDPIRPYSRLRPATPASPRRRLHFARSL
ncbi:hypothetical protein B0H13DRAFT_2331586 [Mycena leptocephala]|nr:hypothetical protein B0H13DRAFT_2331586 [Mycena leptocephala]